MLAPYPSAVPKLRNLRKNEGLERCDGALSPQSTRSQRRLTAYKLAQNRGKFIAVSTAEPLIFPPIASHWHYIQQRAKFCIISNVFLHTLFSEKGEFL
jgi:hypothetical protein